MQERKLNGGRFGKTLFFTDREIDRMCLEALKQSGCLPAAPEPIDIEFFIEKHFKTSLDMGTEVDPEVLGWTLFGKKGEILLVGVSPSLSADTSLVGQRRCRATVAHEAGHCLMHPILFMEERTEPMWGNLDFAQNRILCRKEDFTGKYDGRWWEVQANKAIGGLLLPSGLVQKSVEHLLESQGGLGLPVLPEKNRQKAIEHVAATFEVNKPPAEIRLKSLFPDQPEEFL
jgi:hypothetical protein